LEHPANIPDLFADGYHVGDPEDAGEKIGGAHLYAGGERQRSAKILENLGEDRNHENEHERGRQDSQK
jgi:hypothetical protein